MSRPLRQAILENLKNCRPYVVLCVQPGYRHFWMKRRLPLEATIREQLHSEKGHGETGEAETFISCKWHECSRRTQVLLVVVDTRVHKCRRKVYLPDLSLQIQPAAENSECVVSPGVHSFRLCI